MLTHITHIKLFRIRLYNHVKHSAIISKTYQIAFCILNKVLNTTLSLNRNFVKSETKYICSFTTNSTALYTMNVLIYSNIRSNIKNQYAIPKLIS